MKRALYLILVALLAASCGSGVVLTRESEYPQMYQQKPTVLLVMPPINNTSNVDAKEYLYTSISKPLIEAGYYVISPHIAMELLKAESAYDAELFVEGDLEPFNRVFGADAVIFSEINAWTKSGFGIKTNIHYFIKSAYSGEVLFDRTCDLYLDLSNDSGNNKNNKNWLGALIDLTVAVVNTAMTDHIEAARIANSYIFSDLPEGKYSPNYMIDQNMVVDASDISATVKR
jgi:Uncharacterized protein conserved in bacteria